MVRSLNSLVYELIELYRTNFKVTDSIDERLMATWIQYTRAKLIKQRLDEHMRIPDEHWVQDLGSVEMEIIDSSVSSELNTGAISSGKTILRSVEEIPSTIHFKGAPGGFTRIGPADLLSRGYNIVTYQRALDSGYSKFNRNDIYAFLHGKHVYIVNRNQTHKFIKYINITGIFQNPIEAYEFNSDNSTYDWDYEYPISEALVGDMKNIILQENFKLIMMPMDDKTPNSIDNITNPPPEEGIINPNKR